ncbi:U-box domain-containing protein 9-like [Rhododendron vialii]|uniref:U-box domain-containing protein 9-like n=1 Tax=Rhododendron vialii TaxID=182163 RepID=UPI00265E66E4|nr:U-box domain-containing protein 9-like [Rhododendron vialii]
MKLILDEDDYAVQELDKAISILSSLKQARGIETTDEAIRIVSSLTELKTKESVPNESKCPMSGETMGDPVVVASGRESYSCFNWLLKILNGIKGFIDAAVLASPDRSRIDSLLDNMSSSLSDQKSSAKTLRWLTDEYPPYRDLLGNNEAVSKLLEPLVVPRNACLDLHLQGDIIATVLNISLPEGNKKAVVEKESGGRKSACDPLAYGCLENRYHSDEEECC